MSKCQSITITRQDIELQGTIPNAKEIKYANIDLQSFVFLSQSDVLWRTLYKPKESVGAHNSQVWIVQTNFTYYFESHDDVF